MANIKFKDIKESREFVIIDPRGNARPVGAKSQGAQYIKKMGGPRKGYHMVLKKNALKARRAIEKNGGNSTNSKIQDIMFDLLYEGKLTEARLSSEQNKALDNMNDWLPKGKEEEYLEILNQERAPAMIKFLTRNADLGVLYKKYKVRGKRDMATLASVLMNEGKVNEGMTSLQKKVRDEIDGMAVNHYANVQNKFGVEDDKQMHKFITGLSDSDAKKLLQQIKKKMFEGKLKENKMIKFKDILKEAAWDHTSGKSLPTLADVQKAYTAKKHLQETELTEAPMDKKFGKDWERNCKVLITHLEHEQKGKLGAHKGTVKKMIDMLRTVKGYPDLMGSLFGES